MPHRRRVHFQCAKDCWRWRIAAQLAGGVGGRQVAGPNKWLAGRLAHAGPGVGSDGLGEGLGDQAFASWQTVGDPIGGGGDGVGAPDVQAQVLVLDATFMADQAVLSFNKLAKAARPVRITHRL